MATPIWDEKKQGWRLRVTRDRVTREFFSSKKGIAGKKEVLKKAREYAEGSTVDRNLTVGACWDKFMSYNEARLGSDSESYKQYAKLGRLYILPEYSKKRISTMKKMDWQNILNTAKPQNKRTKVLSKKYLSNIRMTINVFCKFLEDYELYEGFTGSLFIPQGHPTKGKEILQPDMIRRLFEPSNKWYWNAIRFCLACGLRPSEVIGLQWNDIADGLIYIRRGVTTSKKVSAGKNANAIRKIPLSPFINEILDVQRKQTETFNSEWVFCSIIGTMGSQSTMGHHYEELRDERNLVGSLYSLRHTYISIISTVIPESTLRLMVGHSEKFDSFGVYKHEVSGELQEASKVIDLTFGKLAK